MNNLTRLRAIQEEIKRYFAEDDLSRNFSYINSLPGETVNCTIYFKDTLIVAGLPFFFETIRYLLPDFTYQHLLKLEGQEVKKGESISFKLPFNVAIVAERIALNLLQRSSSIATFTNQFVQRVLQKDIAILDTRKTTPGLRMLEKYAVTVGGGKNHRFASCDVFMIKDNHKSFFGGIKKAYDFFKSINSFYTPIIVEIHSIDEIEEAKQLGLRHLMLDNFTPAMVKEAIKIKTTSMTYEVSGGINLSSINDYAIEGVDAISIGQITYNAPSVDISFKYGK